MNAGSVPNDTVKPWGQPTRALSVLLQPGSIGEPRGAGVCAEFAFVRGVEWRYLTMFKGIFNFEN